ncbi:YbaB/EbfC family nucleoid-associated protein [Actinoplanes sp. NPDC048796]|uniref:YbaB/EbfC family nucleoid-associated protein n=1 Tax=Actinoplanes sp. NPDC048796 TaxID=3155640 RepID=UPI0033EFC523
MTTPDDWVRSFELQAEAQVARSLELSRRLEANVVSASSPDGEVRLTVDSSGGLASLAFGAAARDLPLDELASLVLRTSRRAQAQLAASMREVASEIYGGGSETASFLSSTYAERFPEPVEDDDEGRRT